MPSCNHDQFEASVNVNRIEAFSVFNAEVRIRCVQCGVAMRFIGLPYGLDLNGAAVSADGEEARLAIAPRGEVANIHD